MQDCKCDPPDDWYMCIYGRLYGPCDWESCGGICIDIGACECECHAV